MVYLVASQKSKGRAYTGLLLACAVLAALATIYIEITYDQLKMRAWFNTGPDLVAGIILIVLSLDAARRAFGLLVPLMSVIVVIYPFLGHHLPEPFYCTSYSLARTISNLSLTFQNGLHDSALEASANYIFLFVIFGGVLQAVGATRFFLELAKLVGGRFKGGPGMMAVLSSAGVGSITGSVVANMTITGAFYHPTDEGGWVQTGTSWRH